MELRGPGIFPSWSKQKTLRCIAAQPIEKLRESLLVEILIRLPNPRTAVQCKSVCKRWRALISSRSFIARFISHRETNTGGGELGGESPLIVPAHHPQPILDFLPAPDEIRMKLRILDSFEDLILCGTDGEKARSSEMGRTFVVCNPFTKQWVALPLAPETKTRYDKSIARIICEPRNDPENPNRRFRVVFMYVDGIDLSLDVYCSANGKWSPDWRSRRFPCRNVASCNGKLYWRDMGQAISVYDPFRGGGPDKLDISSFFVEKLVYCDVWASKGVLHLILIESSTTSDRLKDILCVWSFDDGASEWKKGYRVELNEMLSEVKDMEMKRVVGMHPNKPEIVFMEFFIHSDGRTRVLACDLERQELEFFAESPTKLDFVDWNVFQPDCNWPVQIPGYQRLRGGYDGSCSFWVQKSSSRMIQTRPRQSK